jgi:GntR family transcriptional regulator, rspAB operon transcriptional repressor
MTSLQRLIPHSMAERVYEMLEQAIVGGEFSPEERLNDREVAERLGVSRTPVREALHMLQSSGLVERRVGIGWVVAPVGTRDLEELFELRALLEPAALGRIVQWPQEQLEEVAGLFDPFTAPMPDEQIPAYLGADDEFHVRLIQATGNRRIIEAYRVVERQIDRLRHYTSYRSEGRVDESLGEHLRVSRALRDRDASAARLALVNHIESAKRAYVDGHSPRAAQTES